jgi:GNAT superfamily N-acetyltransferase
MFLTAVHVIMYADCTMFPFRRDTVNFYTLDCWDEGEWCRAAPIFEDGFPPQGRKTSAMIRKILDRSEGYLHLCAIEEDLVAMAVTGKLPEINALLIDYVAVQRSRRGEGIGRRMIKYIGREALRSGHRGMVIEIEAEPNVANESRRRFWLSLGFLPTKYVHQYRWVPEPYQAMYLEWGDQAALPHDGRALFGSITGFHEKIYRKH